MTPPLRPPPTIAALVEDFLAKLASGVWRDGDRLPPERLLARQYRVARNTLRGALDILEEQGWLRRHVGRGTFVQIRKSVSADLLASQTVGASPEDLLEARTVIEPEVAALAAVRASAAELHEIELARRANLAATSSDDFDRSDAEFHFAMFRATRNQILIAYGRAIFELRRQAQWSELKERMATEENRARTRQYYDDILLALARRDPQAACKAVERHLIRLHSILVAAS